MNKNRCALLEPRINYIYERKLRNRSNGPYTPKSSEEIEAGLHRLFESMGFTNIVISDVGRMSGGASKEQFAFSLKHEALPVAERFVLRMDPLEGIVETCRLREAELIAALQGVIPLPAVLAVDAEGDFLGRPGVICSLVSGVTAPTAESGKGVSGIGIGYGSYANKIAPQFVDLLAKIHAWDGSGAELPSYVKPVEGTTEAAVYQINYWAKAWAIDKVEPVPLITYTETWLRENAPVCDTPCLLHCDYRIGNFLFEEPSGKITAILDWELAHFGDFHEDLAWSLHPFFGTKSDEGEFLVCGLMPRAQFIAEYQRLSGRVIDTRVLKYYEVMNAWKCALMGFSSAIMAAKNGNNHQDLLITWLGSAGGVHMSHMVSLIKEYDAMCHDG
ncbi:MAG: phosphotransferase family protein [Porticoccaceae bacterium]|nr:phosphotransferase family protein [Pseudomonadales bacterium]MCP5173093.1 phosphotransferase family protein [Pseudomonadales bacterium]